MRDREGEIEKERVVSVLLNEAECVIRHHVEGVIIPLVSFILLWISRICAFETLVCRKVLVIQIDSASVPPQVCGVEIVSELLI